VDGTTQTQRLEQQVGPNNSFLHKNWELRIKKIKSKRKKIKTWTNLHSLFTYTICSFVPIAKPI